jgi:hypothetical protein
MFALVRNPVFWPINRLVFSQEVAPFKLKNWVLLSTAKREFKPIILANTRVVKRLVNNPKFEGN